jgi:hypothetical protein
MARSVFLYLFNSNEHIYTLQSFQSAPGINFNPNFKAEGVLFGDFHLNVKPQIYAAGNLEAGSLAYYTEPPKVGTVMIVPIMLRGSVFLGILGLDSIDRDAWGHEDIDLVKLFADLFSTSIWQIDAIDRQSTHIQFFRDLCRLNTELPIGIEALELFKEAGQILHKFFSFDKLTFAVLKEEESPELYIEFVDGYDNDNSIGHRIVWNGGLGRILLRTRTVLREIIKKQNRIPFSTGDQNTQPFRSCLGVPLEVGRKSAGWNLAGELQPQAICRKRATHWSCSVKT